jgi:serine/threonine protein kinase
VRKPALPSRATCPTEEELVAYVAGVTPPHLEPERLLSHLDDCKTCRQLIAEAARAHQGSDFSQPGSIGTFGEQQTLVDRYRIQRFLARGGMGEVYLAEDLLLEENVALKTLSCTALDDPRAAFRFKAEARLARRVSHHNVCRILEFGVHGYQRPGRQAELVPFLTMEFLVGETLAHRVARRGKLPEREAVPLLDQILAGLAAIHACGIVHRDLKSENAFLVPDARGRERVVVMDFGLARCLDGRVVSTSPLERVMVGTTDTMAPEQIRGQAPQPAVDVFAFGVLVFEVLVGRRPFVGVSPWKRLSDPAPRLAAVAPELGPAWDQLVARCLANDPAARFGDLAELQAAMPRPR